MKYLMSLFVSVLFIVSTQASAFITVIDVEEINGQITTITNPSEYTLEQMNTKYLSYRGQAEAAAQLFSDMADKIAPGLVEVEYEINAETQTIALTVKVQGFVGFDYSYWIIKKSGE